MTRAALAFFAATLLATLVVSAPVAPASALSCGNRLVVVGDSSAHVRGVCGDPASTMTRTETRTQFITSSVPGGGGAGQVVSITVQIDTWVYDFGPRRFMEELTFENGVLTHMRSLGYGTARGGRRSSIEVDARDRSASVDRAIRVTDVLPARVRVADVLPARVRVAVVMPARARAAG